MSLRYNGTTILYGILKSMDKARLLQKKVRDMFSDEEDRKRVSRILERYGEESHEREAVRVRLAVLKLSGPNVSEVEKMTNYAKQDFKDIISWAEYPRQSKSLSLSGRENKQRMIEYDKKEYEEWLNS